MFRIAKQAVGAKGAFVKLVQLDPDDYAVIVRYPGDGRLHHMYIGPDPNKAEEVFGAELKKISSQTDLH